MERDLNKPTFIAELRQVIMDHLNCLEKYVVKLINPN